LLISALLLEPSWHVHTVGAATVCDSGIRIGGHTCHCIRCLLAAWLLSCMCHSVHACMGDCLLAAAPLRISAYIGHDVPLDAQQQVHAALCMGRKCWTMFICAGLGYWLAVAAAADVLCAHISSFAATVGTAAVSCVQGQGMWLTMWWCACYMCTLERSSTINAGNQTAVLLCQCGQDQHRLVSFVHPSSRAASSSNDDRCSPLSRRWGALTPVILREAAKKSSIHDRKSEEQQQQQQQG
jgi:hypothetical protein